MNTDKNGPKYVFEYGRWE